LCRIGHAGSVDRLLRRFIWQPRFFAFQQSLSSQTHVFMSTGFRL
jgi:hypothetical protein